MYIHVVVGPLEDSSKLLGSLKEIKMGSELKNCGLETACEGTPIQVFTGDTDSVMPHVCVGGKMLVCNYSLIIVLWKYFYEHIF